MHLNLLKDAKFLLVEAAAAAGQTELVSDTVDMQGFDSVCFIAITGDVTSGSVLGLTAKTNTADSVSSPTPTTLTGALAFTAGTTDADSKLFILDIHKPRDQYVFASFTRTTQNAVVNSVLAILYNANQKPVTQDAVVLASALLNDPASA